jgi:hypothetical protein
MYPMRSYLNLRCLPAKCFAVASTRQSQTSLLGAFALCAAMLATGTLAYPASRNPNAPSPSNGSIMAPTISSEEAAAKGETLHYAMVVPDGESEAALSVDPLTSYYGTWTVYPFTKKFLTSFVAYNNKCQEVGHGTWYEGSVAPKYGQVTQALVKGKLSNGACSKYIFTGAGIYYKWVYKTGSTHNDEFKAYWKGGSLQNNVTFYLKNR